EPLFAQPAFEIGDQRRAQFLPDSPTMLSALAVDRAFDVEQGVDAPDRLQCQRRDDRRRFALRRAAGGRSEIGHLEEGAAGVDPARCLDERPRLAGGLVQLVVPTISVGLEYPGIAS